MPCTALRTATEGDLSIYETLTGLKLDAIDEEPAMASFSSLMFAEPWASAGGAVIETSSAVFEASSDGSPGSVLVADGAVFESLIAWRRKERHVRCESLNVDHQHYCIAHHLMLKRVTRGLVTRTSLLTFVRSTFSGGFSLSSSLS